MSDIVKTAFAPQTFGGGLSHSVVAAPSAPLKSINQRFEKYILTEITEKRRRDRPRQLDRKVDRRKESRTESVVRKVEAKNKMCQNGHALWRFRHQKTLRLRKEKSANETFGHTKIRKPPRTDFHPKFWILLPFWENVRINSIFVLEKVNWTDTGQMKAGNRSTIVQLSFTIVHRSNQSRQSFNYRSTIVQLSFNYRSTIVQVSFNYRSTILRGTEGNQMRAGNRATFMQIIVQACVALSWFWGTFWEFCSVLPFFVFLWFFPRKTW